MTFDLFIFDLDGTLVDTLEIWSDISEAFLARFGIFATRQEIGKMDTMSFREGSKYLRTHFGVPLDEQALSEAWFETAVEIFDSRVELMPHALAMLASLRGRGAKLVIFSQSPRRLVEGMMERLGLAQAVDAVLLAGETTFEKGDPRALLEIARRFETPPSRTAVVDDAPYALRAAKQAGIFCYSLSYRNPKAKEALDVADVMLEDLSSL